MDSYSDYPDQFDGPTAAAAEPQPDVASAIGSDERRMHVRAYNYWCSLLDGRDYPSIEDLEPGNIQDFGPNSVLLDFTEGSDNPATPYIGSAVREECGIGDDIKTINDVPSRSLLSRLTDHYMQIIANRAPVGFEAEFVNQRGRSICYRGILMPFSSDGDTIDFIYGVINWKDVGEAAEVPQVIRAALPPLEPETDEAEEEEEDTLDLVVPMTSEPEPEEDCPAAPHLTWEDGPLADAEEHAPPVEDEEEATIQLDDEAGLADRLWAARESAEVCKQADGRSRVALYRALAMAYDFAVAAKRVPEDYAEILDDAGVKSQARAPMTPIVKLVFGIDYDKTRLTEFAAALNYAERENVDFGGFQDFLDAADGGLKGLVAAERKARRPDKRQEDKAEAGRAALRAA
ncbi:MAG: PAS domain-containing protein, partial [Sphingomicrobium sp.]